jgi:hypothetical protein
VFRPFRKRSAFGASTRHLAFGLGSELQPIDGVFRLGAAARCVVATRGAPIGNAYGLRSTSA